MASFAALKRTTQRLIDEVDPLRFGAPITHVYNPLVYARRAHEAYLRMGKGKKRVLWLGMNPGPWGMAQVGVPFGEVAHVRDWLRIEAKIDKPAVEHPKRPIQGFACPRSEVSGRRLWGFVAERFQTPDQFFAEHFILNYCPLVFMEEGGRNFTPDKLPRAERDALEAACDRALAEFVRIFDPEWVLGVGKFAEKRAKVVLGDERRIGTIPHPSPASPAANRGWDALASRALKELGIQIPG